MFQWSLEEAKWIQVLRSQIVILSRGQNLRCVAYIFTKLWTVMAANVLNSPVAVHAGIQAA